MGDITPCGNAACDTTVTQPERGRRRKYCSRACQQTAFRGRSVRDELQRGHGTNLQKEARFVTKTSGETSDLQRAKTSQRADLEKAGFYWIEVNDVTWKLTDGEMERTPACHGKWPGFNIERGLAWVMDVGWVARKAVWFARCGNQSYGPTDIADAKQAAFAMVTGARIEPIGKARAWTKAKMQLTQRAVSKAQRTLPVKSSSGAIPNGTGKGIDGAISAAMRDWK